ncbi:hypothetical protein TYRP_010079 [Tyrophagus putrescentiae]|nr:hypothetical protein TYRP_010079 [Tyrophagus putrescentiae]
MPTLIGRFNELLHQLSSSSTSAQQQHQQHSSTSPTTRQHQHRQRQQAPSSAVPSRTSVARHQNSAGGGNVHRHASLSAADRPSPLKSQLQQQQQPQRSSNAGKSGGSGSDRSTSHSRSSSGSRPTAAAVKSAAEEHAVDGGGHQNGHQQQHRSGHHRSHHRSGGSSSSSQHPKSQHQQQHHSQRQSNQQSSTSTSSSSRRDRSSSSRRDSTSSVSQHQRRSTHQQLAGSSSRRRHSIASVTSANGGGPSAAVSEHRNLIKCSDNHHDQHCCKCGAKQQQQHNNVPSKTTVMNRRKGSTGEAAADSSSVNGESGEETLASKFVRKMKISGITRKGSNCTPSDSNSRPTATSKVSASSSSSSATATNHGGGGSSASQKAADKAAAKQAKQQAKLLQQQNSRNGKTSKKKSAEAEMAAEEAAKGCFIYRYLNGHLVKQHPEIVSGKTCYDLPVKDIESLATAVVASCTGPSGGLATVNCSPPKPFDLAADLEVDFIDEDYPTDSSLSSSNGGGPGDCPHHHHLSSSSSSPRHHHKSPKSSDSTASTVSSDVGDEGTGGGTPENASPVNGGGTGGAYSSLESDSCSPIAGINDWSREKDFAYGISTTLNAGDPIADSFAVVVRENSAIIALADGVNWGEGACLASRCAVYGCMDYLNRALYSPAESTRVRNTLDIFVALLRSFNAAHDLILAQGGHLTTLCAAVVCQLKNSDRFIVCTCNVGDSLAYVYSPVYGVREITQESHDIFSMRDMRDALGALGPVSGREPELNNLTVAMTVVDVGDIVFLTSDGISDNFDPVVGKFAMPKKEVVVGENGAVAPEAVPEKSTVKESGNGKAAKAVKARKSVQRSNSNPERSSSRHRPPPLNPENYTSKASHCTARAKRTARELCHLMVEFPTKLTNAKRRILEDPELYSDSEEDLLGAEAYGRQRQRRRQVGARLMQMPGKLDHASIAAIEIGFFGAVAARRASLLPMTTTNATSNYRRTTNGGRSSSGDHQKSHQHNSHQQQQQRMAPLSVHDEDDDHDDPRFNLKMKATLARFESQDFLECCLMWRYSTATKRRTVKLSHDKMSTLRTCHARPAASTLTRQFWRKAGFEKVQRSAGPIPKIRPVARSIQGTRKSAPESVATSSSPPLRLLLSHRLHPTPLMVETRSGLNTSAPSSSESGTMPKETTPSPLSTRTVESATGEREELRKRIQKLSRMASLRRPIDMSLQDCDLLSDALLELDEYLEEDEESAHYAMMGSLREYLVQRDQAASAAAIAAICSQDNPSAVTSSAAGLHPPLHSTLMPPGYGWPLLGSLASSLSTAASSTTTTSAAGAPRLSNVFTNTGVFNQTPLLGPTLSLPSQFASQPAFTGQSGLSGLSMRRFPTTVKKDDIPRFDGRPSSWSRFKERFISVVGENPNLKEIDKLDHLATAIPSSAKTVLSFANWDQALADLEVEYADPDEVINDLLHLASDVKPLGKQARGAEWKAFREEVKNIIRLSEHHDATLQRSLHTALALKLGEHRMEYIRQFGGKTLAQLNAYVGKELEAYRIAEHHEATARASASLPISSSATGRTVAPKPVAHTKPKQVHTISAPTRPVVPCFFCDGDHLRRECPLDLQQRTEGLRARNRCFRCLAKRSDPAHPSDCQAHDLQVHRPTDSRSTHQAEAAAAAAAHYPKPTPEPPVSSNRTIAHVSFQQGGIRSETPIEITPTDVVYLPTVRAIAEGAEGYPSRDIRLFGDGGSTTTFVSEKLALELGLQLRPIRPFRASVFGGSYTCAVSEKTTMRIRSRIDARFFNDVEAFVMRGTLVMPLPLPSEELLRVARLRGVELSEHSSAEQFASVDILLGEDLMEEVLYEEGMSRIKPNVSLSFEETRYGWILRGNTGKPSSKYTGCLYVEPDEDTLSDGDLTRLFGVYNVCGTAFDAPVLSPASSVQPLEPTTCRGLCQDLAKVLGDPLSDDGPQKDIVGREWRAAYDATLAYDPQTRRYTAGFPWHSERRPAPNFSAAKGFAFHMRKTLREKGLFQAYTASLGAFIEEDYARELSPPFPEDGYYLQHFPVCKPESTTPIRPVFNASSAAKDQLSLNRALCKGSWDQTQLVHELIRFRTKKYVLLGDIKKAFLQIRIKEEERKYARYLWFDSNGNLRAFELTSLLFGAVSSPFILHAVLVDLFRRFAPDLIHVISDTYMDDVLLHADSLPELQHKMDRVIETMARASFTLHKWLAAPEVAQALGLQNSKSEGSYLGARWRLVDEELFLSVPVSLPTRFTRRALLSFFASIFDPLGLIGPFHTTIKILMRELLKESPTWDEPIGAATEKQARSLIQDVVEYLPRVRHRRLVACSGPLELWVFGDASKAAYGICIYVHDAVDKHTELLLSRGHLPSQNKTIPELELVAATLAVDTYVKIRDSLPFLPARVRFFTDSQVTWHRIQADANKFAAFVMNRVRRIQASSSPAQWYFIPGKVNPADLVSRGTLIRHLISSDLWAHGPSFEEIIGAEQQTALLSCEPPLVHSISQPAPDDYAQALVNNNNYSRLRSALSVLLQLADRKMHVLRAYQQHYGQDVDLALLTDILLWRLIQKATLLPELQSIRSGLPMPSSSPLAKVPLSLDRFGLLRLERRLANAEVSDGLKRPLVMVDHAIVRSYIHFVHEAHCHHAGSHTTKGHFSQFVFLPGCSRIVSQVVAACLRCRRLRTAKPYSAPMAPLPEDRVTRGFAFQCVGLDLFGPLHSVSGRVLKFYGVIFACAKSRAVHLELIESRATEDILRAYLRFVGIYGEPVLIRSDNELGFIKLNKTIQANQAAFRKAVKQMQAHPKGRTATWIDADTPAASEHRLRWAFNVPDAPSWGGFYERLIQSVKRSLDRCRLASSQSFEKILTLLREAQLIINSRPLVTSSTDGTVLTPGHLLFGRRLQSPAPVKYPMSAKDDVLLEYSRFQSELDRFWTIWESDYLTSLRNYKWTRSDPPLLNELVAVQKDGVPRYAWELGRIRKLLPGKDGHIRALQIELLSGGLRLRQIQRVYPLEHPTDLSPGEDVAHPDSAVLAQSRLREGAAERYLKGRLPFSRQVEIRPDSENQACCPEHSRHPQVCSRGRSSQKDRRSCCTDHPRVVVPRQ